MSRAELFQAYQEALQEFIIEVKNTQVSSMSQDESGIVAQQAREDAAYKRYLEARAAFFNA
jgi:hypothetical protein